jgi:splicing factor U2AF subunit
MWSNPETTVTAAGGDFASMDQEKLQDDFDDFFEEIYDEMAKYGKLEELNVCENLGDHIVGNVYVKFEDEENAADALQGLLGRYYAGSQLQAEYSPVTDFREARCRQFDETKCSRGGYCNFMHVKKPSKALWREIDRANRKRYKQKERSRSRSPRRRGSSRSRSRERSRSDRDRSDRDRSDRDHRSERGRDDRSERSDKDRRSERPDKETSTPGEPQESNHQPSDDRSAEKA